MHFADTSASANAAVQLQGARYKLGAEIYLFLPNEVETPPADPDGK